MPVDLTAPDAPAPGSGDSVRAPALTRREIRERERATQLAEESSASQAGTEQAGTEQADTAVLPIVPEVPTRTAVLPVIPQPARETASYSELINALAMPAPEAAPLTSAESFVAAVQSESSSASAPAEVAPAEVAPADAEPAEAAPALRRARRAAAADVDATPAAALAASGASSARRAVRGSDDVARERSAQTDAVIAADSPFFTSQPFASQPSTSQPRPVAVTPALSGTATAPAVRPLGRRLLAKTTAVVAMGFVALMAVATSVPAEALLTSDDVKAAALVAKSSANTEPGQSIVASGANSITVQTDGYETATIAENAAASGIRMESTFVNNPNGTVQWPFAVGVHVGDRFGYRDCAGCSSNHGGQDFNPGLGAEIQSIADGTVTYAEDGEGSLGVHMMIEHQVNGETVTSVYAHMQHGSMLYSVGDTVKAGDPIGNTGNTGMSTGPHLHFEIRLGGIDGIKVDPLDWLYANTN